jgi:hypothetical protein
MAKASHTEFAHPSSSKGSPAHEGMKGGKTPKTTENPTFGGKGDRDGKGDIQAKKAGTSIGKRVASK